MFWCDCEPVEGGWIASCEETGQSAFGRTADSASRILCLKNDAWHAEKTKRENMS